MNKRGMTLIELLVTMFIGGIMAYIVGMIMLSTFTESIRSFQQSSLQDDVRLFERRLGKQFRSALNEAAYINSDGGTGSLAAEDTLRFVSYIADGFVANQFLQYIYEINGKNLVCRITPMERNAWGVLGPVVGAVTRTEIVMADVDSVRFSWVGWPAMHTVRTVVNQRKILPGSKLYVQSSTFDVLSRNRL